MAVLPGVRHTLSPGIWYTNLTGSESVWELGTSKKRTGDFQE